MKKLLFLVLLFLTQTGHSKNYTLVVRGNGHQFFIQYNNGDISIDSLLSNELELMSVCNISELDSIQQDIYTTFTKNVMETVQKFNPLKMGTYAQSLSENIRKSRLPKEYKIDLTRTANIILNSTLCWQ